MFTTTCFFLRQLGQQRQLYIQILYNYIRKIDMTDVSAYKKYIYDIVGALHEVHKELGAGLNEACYQEGLRMQFEESGIDFSRELSFHPTYHGRQMESLYRVDFLCKGNVVVECKAVAELVSNHRAQLQQSGSWFSASQIPQGSLANRVRDYRLYTVSPLI
jgi:GxxExxY protein